MWNADVDETARVILLDEPDMREFVEALRAEHPEVQLFEAIDDYWARYNFYMTRLPTHDVVTGNPLTRG